MAVVWPFRWVLMVRDFGGHFLAVLPAAAIGTIALPLGESVLAGGRMSHPQCGRRGQWRGYGRFAGF